MAKGKHAAALFEVIHAANKKDGGRDSMRTPKWWFKSRDKADKAKAAAATSTSTSTRSGAARSTAITPSGSVAGVTVVSPSASHPSPPIHTPVAEFDPTEASRDVTTPLRESYRDSHRDSNDPAPAPVDVDVDPRRQQITFRLTYTSAAIGAFGLAVVLGLAYLIGSRMTKGPSVASAVSTEQLLKGPARPDVLKVSNTKSPDDSTSAANTAAKPPVPKLVSPPPAQTPTGGSPPTAPTDGRRVVGRNYIVAQSYPDAETANSAVALLKKNGIECTVEKIDYAPNWFSVVTSTGFDRTKTAECENFVKSVRDIGNQLSGAGAKFKKFEPQAYKWKETR